MKRFLLLVLPLTAALYVSAQTYHNGTWYSYYDDNTHTMNTQGDYEHGGVFAPTAGKLNVQWKYEWVDWVGFARKIDTDVLESANNGDNTTKIGSLAENTDKNSNTTESFSISENINWIKYERSGVPTHKVILYHEDIPLAKHILLASGEYGAKTASHDFGEKELDAAPEEYMVHLRSFLTAGDITMTSSNPEVFRIGDPDNKESIVYAVGANSCASANGKASAAGGSALGKIGNYDFPVYFTPQKGGTFNGTITISDGTSVATVLLKGSAPKKEQTITWNPELTLLNNATIEGATASSELPVTYSFDPEDIVTLVDGVLTAQKDGVVTITASQAGNEIYNPAEPVVKTFTIYPAVTEYAYSVMVCEGEAYVDALFGELSEAGVYKDTIPNAYGGDSIITLTLGHYPRYAYAEEKKMYVGALEEWQGVDLSLLPVGDTTLVAKYNTVYGCDSTYTLNLTVNERPTTYGELRLDFCEGESVAYQGKVYTSSAEEEVLLEEKNHMGGDSIVRLKVYSHSLSNVDEGELSIREGTARTWQGIDLSLLPVGDTTLVAAYSSIYGCDSTYTLKLTVVAKPTAPTIYGADTLNVCAGESVEYAGKTYKRPTVDSVLFENANYLGGDSVVVLVVKVLPAMRQKATKTIVEGDEETWQDIDLSLLPVGDTTLVAAYSSIYGCDSTYTLKLTVVAKVIEGLDDIKEDDRAEKFFHNGHLYIRKRGRVYNLQGVKVE